MADLPCSGFPCPEIYYWVRIKIIFIGKSPECPWPDSKDLDKEKDDLRKELEKTYPPFVRMNCPNHCHCEPIGKPITDIPVKGQQRYRPFRANNCEYYLIFEFDVEVTIQLGICREGARS